METGGDNVLNGKKVTRLTCFPQQPVTSIERLMTFSFAEGITTTDSCYSSIPLLEIRLAPDN